MSQLAPVPVVDRSAMGHAMGCWTTGVAVITTVDRNGRPHGMTVSSLTSVSLDPPLLLACLTHGARTAGAVLDAGRFGRVHPRRPARAHRPPLRRPRRRPLRRATANYGHHQLPAVPGALAHLDCTLDRHIDPGDHVIVFGAVQRTCHRDGEPMAFLSGRFGDYTDRGHEPVDRFF